MREGGRRAGGLGHGIAGDGDGQRFLQEIEGRVS
jgi:hypothetical protein